jgi:N-formylglutamate deformylase
MPSAAGPKDDRPRADVVIGDRYGTSCLAVIADTIEATLRELGYTVGRNKPYAGGFITEHYGNPAAGLHTIQLEINRALYMDERRLMRADSFATVAHHIALVSDRLNEVVMQELHASYRSAAE